jgi:hypothetical protein
MKRLNVLRCYRNSLRVIINVPSYFLPQFSFLNVESRTNISSRLSYFDTENADKCSGIRQAEIKC